MVGIVLKGLRKTFLGGKRVALDNLSADIPSGKITGIVGPDGAGKTTLIRVLAGLMRLDGGSCEVGEYHTDREPEKIQKNLGYLPQRFGLYEDLTVAQNLALYTELQGVIKGDPIIEKLLAFSGLAPFQQRLAGELSGGMKQKLGLMATLLRKPKLLLLDEPTTGVDPISQEELWKMFSELNRDGMTIITSTSYLDEAEKCHHTLLLSEGNLLFAGTPEAFKIGVKGKTYYFNGIPAKARRSVLDTLVGKNGIIDSIVEGEKIRVTFNTTQPISDPAAYGLGAEVTLLPRAPNFEDAFIEKLGGVQKRPAVRFARREQELTIQAKGLTRCFGTFKAVDNISFTIHRGEIFGLLGPNGAGKSTTFKMLCGLLRPTEGEALVGGLSMRDAPSEARGLIGYMAQKFSLYDNLTVIQNLRFFSGIYPVENRPRAIEEMLTVFDLGSYCDALALDLPLGFKQRLALSCALMHQPRVLFLDEPTSGVDPLTRREFWHQINLLAAAGVSVVVSTHLMDEAEFCDRIGLIFKGGLRVVDTPDRLKAAVPPAISVAPTLADAFRYFCSGKQHEGLER